MAAERISLRPARPALALAVAALAGWACVARPRPGAVDARRFDPDAVAEAELEMWRAYYAGQPVRLFALLTGALRDQFNLTWAQALPVSLHFARAAARFYALRGGYEAEVLPELEAGYAEVGELSQEPVDSRVLAQAELGWWVVRRQPEGQEQPERVGQAIARLYAAAYQLPEAQVLPAGELRARAAYLRDHAGDHPTEGDWQQIGQLLHASYRALREEAARPATGS